MSTSSRTLDRQAPEHSRSAGVVGLLGIGAMGRGIAKNLVSAGFTVRGYDPRTEALKELESFGGVTVASPTEAARGSQWVITCLPGHEQVLEALFGATGAVEGAAPDTLFIDTSTSLPQESAYLDERLVRENLRFVDASLSGTGATVLTKDVAVLAGGSQENVEACRPVFDGFARTTYHLGPAGSGALAKLLTNVVVVGNRLALAEALALGTKAGMDSAGLLQLLKDGPAYSRAMDLKGEKMIRGDYRPESTLTQSLHGTELLLAEGRRVGTPLFGVAAYSQVAQSAVAMGFGDLDPASLLEALLLMSGIDRRG